jgi:hypothetical protein
VLTDYHAAGLGAILLHRQRLRRVQPFAPALLTAGGGTIWHSIGEGQISLALFAALAVIGVVAMLLGGEFHALIRLNTDQSETSSLGYFLTGFFILDLILLLAAFLSPFSITSNFFGATIVGMGLLWRKHIRIQLFTSSFGKSDLAITTVLLVAAGLWSQENLKGLTVLSDVVISHPWQDIFYHATQVANFSNSTGAFTLTDPGMSGNPLKFYHYGSYLIPSLVARMTEIDAYSITTGIYAPLGLFLAGLAGWFLGYALFGSPGGAIGAVCSILVPDPSYYRLGDRWTSYFFFQQVGLGGEYGVAVLAIAWAYGFAFWRNRNVRWAFAMLLFCGATLFFKATIFLVYALPVAAYFILVDPRWLPKLKAVLMAVLASLGFIGILLIKQMQYAPTLEFSLMGAVYNTKQIVTLSSWKQLFSPASYLTAIGAGSCIILLSTYGLWLLAMAAAMQVGIGWKMPRAVVWFPIFILANHLFVALCLGPNTAAGDAFEVIHKTFVFPYFALTVWTSGMWGTYVYELSLIVKYRWLVFWTVFLIGFGMVYICGSTVQSGTSWGKTMMNLRIPRGLFDVARFLRQNTKPEEVVQWGENDGMCMLAALSERPTYILWYTINSQKPAPEELDRIKTIERILNAQSVAEVFYISRRNGISWIVLSDIHQPSWTYTLAPEFESHGFRAYKF